jgi:hypothetical protein
MEIQVFIDFFLSIYIFFGGRSKEPSTHLSEPKESSGSSL